MNTTTNGTTAEDIGAGLRKLGFVEGAPPHIPAALVRGDICSYRHLRCAGCGHRGHKVRPMSKGREYRLTAQCRACGRFSEDV